MITIKKAIEILTRLHDGADPDECRPEKNAIKLGIEALKCIVTDREGGYFPEGHLLPGETKD